MGEGKEDQEEVEEEDQEADEEGEVQSMHPWGSPMGQCLVGQMICRRMGLLVAMCSKCYKGDLSQQRYQTYQSSGRARVHRRSSLHNDQACTNARTLNISYLSRAQTTMHDLCISRLLMHRQLCWQSRQHEARNKHHK